MHRRILVLALLLPAACAADTEPAEAGACRFAANEYCYDLLDVPDSARFCAEGGGSLSEVSCPTASRVCRCTYSGADDSGDFVSYRISYYAPRTTAECQAGCTGVFEAN